jgi:hypothetical protein
MGLHLKFDAAVRVRYCCVSFLKQAHDWSALLLCVIPEAGPRLHLTQTFIWKIASRHPEINDENLKRFKNKCQ